MQKRILKQFLIVALLHAPTPPQKKNSASVLHSTVSVLADNSVKIADNFPFVTIPTNKRGITDMTRKPAAVTVFTL
jgi:hypothetical protein